MAVAKLFVVGIVVDLLSLILVFMPTIVIFLGHVQPYQRGFFCDDNSIKYPYKDNTIPSWVVFVVGVFVPVGTIIVVELVQFYHNRKFSPSVGSPPDYIINTSCSVPYYVAACYKLIGIFLFGLAITQALTDICKYSIGRLRPHFIDVCRPNITASVACNSSMTGVYVYVEHFTCSAPKGYKLHDSRLSFLSGHTSIALYCALFLVFYLQARFTWRGSKLLRHLIQAVALYAAIYVGLSRISDYKHHWSDVLSGAILGAFVASLVALHVSKMFNRPNSVFPQSDAQSLDDCHLQQSRVGYDAAYVVLQ